MFEWMEAESFYRIFTIFFIFLLGFGFNDFFHVHAYLTWEVHIVMSKSAASDDHFP